MKKTKKVAITKKAATTSNASKQKHRGKVLTRRSVKVTSFDPAEDEILAMGADF